MSNAGLPPDRNTIRSLAYQFAESQGIKHKFSKEKEMAGQHWLMSFLERNKDIAVNEGGGPLFARAQRISREGVSIFLRRNDLNLLYRLKIENTYL